jgi:hypothetical protein
MTKKDLLQEVILAASSSLRCTGCGIEELVLPLDDQPIDEAFAVLYLCDECEEISESMRLAAESSFSQDPIPRSRRKDL